MGRFDRHPEEGMTAAWEHGGVGVSAGMEDGLRWYRKSRPRSAPRGRASGGSIQADKAGYAAVQTPSLYI